MLLIVDGQIYKNERVFIMGLFGILALLILVAIYS